MNADRALGVSATLGAPLPRSFFEQAPETCARLLVGCTLVWEGCAGRILETEAYAAEGDAACHTASRPSARQFIREHLPGVAYIYLNYGLHWMLNVLVKGPAGSGFVLLRALEPTLGLEAMRERRQRQALQELCSGPGKLAQALALSGEDHGRDLCAPERPACFGAPGKAPVVACPRIGIQRERERPWRFLHKESPLVSVRPPR